MLYFCLHLEKKLMCLISDFVQANINGLDMSVTVTKGR